MTDDLEKDSARHNEKMAKKKAARDKIMASKTIEKGLLIVHTGKGKGKSTAAFGMVFRHVGHGMKSGVVQFVKGAWGTGERTVLEKHGPRQSRLGRSQTHDRRSRAKAGDARRTQYRSAL
jgi:ATP:corrinoid adenosyltransferase